MSHFTTDLGRVADELPDALVILDSGGTVTWTNQATVDLMHIDRSEWLGRSVLDLLHEDDRTAASTAFESLVTDGPGSVVDVRMSDSTGGWRHMEIRGRTVPGGTHGDEFLVISVRGTAGVDESTLNPGRRSAD